LTIVHTCHCVGITPNNRESAADVPSPEFSLDVTLERSPEIHYGPSINRHRYEVNLQYADTWMYIFLLYFISSTLSGPCCRNSSFLVVILKQKWHNFPIRGRRGMYMLCLCHYNSIAFYTGFMLNLSSW